MKLRSVLSGITALLLVGGFYTFAFCMVNDVDDAPISMEYYYSTETDAAGEYSGKATTAFPQDSAGAEAAAPDNVQVEPTPDKAYAELDVLDNNPGTNRYAVVTPDVLSLPSGSADASDNSENTDNGVTEVPPDESEYNETISPEEELSFDEEVVDVLGEEEGLYPADDDSTDELELDDDESEAVTKNVYASDDAADEMLQNPAATTVVPGAPSNTDPVTSPELWGVQSINADIVVTVLTPGVTTETVASTAGTGVDISTAETLSVKYGGAVHSHDSFELVCQIVNNEVSASFSDEAIKAQAVAAYSYVKYNNLNGISPSVLVKPNPPQRIVDMVTAVWGKCCYYNGSVAQTVYMASSSGYTSSSANVWGGNYPYLTSVACPFDTSDPNYGIVTKFSSDVIKSSLESKLGITLSADPSNWLKVTGYVDGNYVSEISVDGQTTISGKKLRESILSYQLKSTSFDVIYSADGYFYFTTYGWGHGVGMSQNGANILAKQGYTYVDILKYYYTGIEVL